MLYNQNRTMKALQDKRPYIAAASLCVAGIIAIAYYYFFTGFSATGETRYICIDVDDTVDSVFSKLSPHAKSSAMTALGTLLRHDNYKEAVRTGRYAIKGDDSVLSMFRKLRNGRQEPLRLTIPESRTPELLASALGRKLMADSASIMRVLNDSAAVARLGYDSATVIALFIPNTYEVYWDTSIDNLLQRMKKENAAFWNYARTQKAQALGMTPVAVQTLASIIDEETSKNDEKAMIAGMYINRLKKGMPLQADPTVKFALGDFTLRRIYQDMLRTDSPYNTYRYPGLPPGPIKIASVAGIDAVLNYAHHDYLYMCAKEDFSGRHNFAKTYNEHLANAQRYARALNERGIK